MNVSIITPVAVIGTGVMGRGIVQVLAQAGSEVFAYDAVAASAEAARAQAIEMIEKLAAKGKIPQEIADSAPERIKVAARLDDLADCRLVVEAVAEDVAVKRDLFAQLEDIVAVDCILATNTSSLPVTAIAAGCVRPERVAGFHFFNPVPLMKVVEIICGVRTDPYIALRLSDYARSFGHRPVEAADTPGFLVNHAGRGLTTEGLRIVQERIADPQTVDAILQDAAGFRLGPFALLDLTGLDVSARVFELIYDGFYQEPRFRPSPLANLRVAAGLYGRKSGEGFYRYRNGVREPQSPQASPGSEAPIRCWLGAVDDPYRPAIEALFADAPDTLDRGASPSPDSAIILAPIGDDATTEAVRRGLDAERVVAIDPLFGLEPGARLTLMPCPVTRADVTASVHALLARTRRVSIIADSPGFVCQRTLAIIVNIACDICQQGIGSPEDVDAAVRLGLGYPHGPLEWGDALGSATIVTILNALYAFYRDPRYRPSPWLLRRNLLGRSLLHA